MTHTRKNTLGMTHTTLITPRGEWHTHIHECSRKGANHPDSTPERNGTQTHTGLLSEKSMISSAVKVTFSAPQPHGQHDSQRLTSMILRTSATWAVWSTAPQPLGQHDSPHRSHLSHMGSMIRKGSEEGDKKGENILKLYVGARAQRRGDKKGKSS